MQLVVLVAAQESQTTRRRAAMPNESNGIDIHFAIADAFAIAQGQKRFLSVRRCGVLQCELNQRSIFSFRFAMYSAMILSVTLPELQQKYPRAHRCRPQNCFF